MVEDFSEGVRVRLRQQRGDPGDFDDDVGVGGDPVGVLWALVAGGWVLRGQA